ncbi:MAG: imidazole glycerol phosphate synthase subunit HisH [Candidatus Bathyarchaeia archaeon]
MLRFAIIDYGVGNIRNVKRAFEILGVDAAVRDVKCLEEILMADAVIFPGVGSFSEAVRNLSDIAEELKETIKSGKPVFGICLGLQILFTSSEEGGQSYGLGLVEGKVVKIPAHLKLPHIGWNTIEVKKENPLTREIPNNSFMYFAHTYVPQPARDEVVVAETEYGISFPSIIAEGNIFATQFHPEKSGKNGFKIIENFVEIVKR